jgi:hypothetical protein
MRRALTIVVVVAQVLALGWLAFGDELPGPCAALWRPARSARAPAPAAAQTQNVSDRTALSEPAPTASRARTGPVRTSFLRVHDAQRVTGSVPVRPPEHRARPPLILRI